jgi:hypothetical protein
MRALASWMVPTGMTRVQAFDAREGGAFRISLTCDSPTGTGKTTAQTDTFHLIPISAEAASLATVGRPKRRYTYPGAQLNYTPGGQLRWLRGGPTWSGAMSGSVKTARTKARLSSAGSRRPDETPTQVAARLGKAD